jgi:RHH-type rel operon transcriptional repressor/antitoxin RelB
MAVTKPIAVRLPVEIEQRLARLAEETGRTASFYVRELLLEHLDALEERFWADRVVREWKASDKQSRPAQELWSELGI